MLGASTLVLLLAATDVAPQGHDALAAMLAVGVPADSPAAFMLQAGQALLAGILGGWLGGLVLPKRVGRAD
jgi:hypothetical protein